MKKSFVYVVIALFITSFANGQEFKQGTSVINVGFGLGGSYNTVESLSQRPSISASYEYGMWDVPGPGVVSLGGYLGHKSYKFDNNDKWNYTILGVRGAYHYNGLEIDDLDVYGGAMLSYNMLSYDNTYYAAGTYGNELGISAFIGGRWYFTDNFGAYAELGFGVANLSIGVALRL
ncbi:hypothetical protein [Arenibacter latericius]|uniref:hypothetical protein n=1 Tax=Arenibacter latericius TaxID=86104 RepID=UPI00041DB03D|nr:hypothetical protein [Arenibacter latericius]MDX1364542.1 hypothetical protein [Arenibacter latericius]